MRYAAAFFARAAWPDNFDQVRATAIVLARMAEADALTASNSAQTDLQPVYPLLVEDLARALGYDEPGPDGGVPF